MNSRNKKIEVNSSSLLELKAELFRKQEEFKQTKLKKESGIYEAKTTVGKKPNIWAKENIGVLQRAQNDLEEKKEEEDILQKSRKTLEMKTQLYEKMSKEIQVLGNEEESPYLVDFERKILNEEKEMRQKENEVQQKNKDKVEETNLNPDEEWVDFVDCLGRSRRCLRKDLPHFLEVDKSLKSEKNEKEVVTEWRSDNDLLSADMTKEIQRKQWEEEEQEALKKPVGPIHFQNVEYKEVRDFGVGYYAFSKEEMERKQQMEMLNNLRKQTEGQRTQREKIKERRKALLKERLDKVKQRKKAKLGLEEDNSETDNSDVEKDLPASEIEEVSTSTTSQVSTSVVDKKNLKPPKIRPWDVGKVSDPVLRSQESKNTMSSATWIEKERSKRNQAFAPPQFYFDSSESATNINVEHQKPRKKLWNRGYVSNYSDTFSESVSNIPIPPET